MRETEKKHKHGMYTKTTHRIRVTVKPTFLEDQSLPSSHHYVWAYQIWIENQGSETIQIIRRHWKITDAYGFLHEVKGEGIVGEKPSIEPGKTYHYTSGTPLSTPSGMMAGSYHVICASGEEFDVEIPLFSLDSPYEKAAVH